jgi:hypothetical protein
MQLQEQESDSAKAQDLGLSTQPAQVDQAAPRRVTPQAQASGPLPQTPELKDLLAPQGERPPSPSELAFGSAAPKAQDAGAATTAADPVKTSIPGGSCDITVTQPAESAVTSVINNHPLFRTTVTVPFALMWEQLKSLGTVSEAELRQVVSVEAIGATKDPVGFTIAGDALSLTASGLDAAQQSNAISYWLMLSSNKSICLSATAGSFHTDVSEWNRAGLRMQIAQLQDEVKQYSALQAQDQALGDRPPPADVSKEQADLQTTTAALAETDAQMHTLEATLRARLETEQPAIRGMLMESVAEASTDDGMAKIKAGAEHFEQTADSLAGIQHQLDGAKANADNLRNALVGIGEVPPDLQQELAAQDAAVQALSGKRDAVAAQLSTQQGELNQLLDAQDGAWDRVLMNYQSSKSGTDPSLQALVSAHRTSQTNIAYLQKTIADKQNEAVMEGVAAKARAGTDAATVANAQKQISAAQAALAAIKGPVYVTLGPDGTELKTPASPA